SGRPTTMNWGLPGPVSTSTSTITPSRPIVAQLRILASISPHLSEPPPRALDHHHPEDARADALEGFLRLHRIVSTGHAGRDHQNRRVDVGRDGDRVAVAGQRWTGHDEVIVARTQAFERVSQTG